MVGARQLVVDTHELRAEKTRRRARGTHSVRTNGTLTLKVVSAPSPQTRLPLERCQAPRYSRRGGAERHADSVTPKPDSPHIPHDKVTKVTNSCHKPLSEGHHHPPPGRFKSSLGHKDVWSSDYIKSPLTRTSVLVRGGLSSRQSTCHVTEMGGDHLTMTSSRRPTGSMLDQGSRPR